MLILDSYETLHIFIIPIKFQGGAKKSPETPEITNRMSVNTRTEIHLCLRPHWGGELIWVVKFSLHVSTWGPTPIDGGRSDDEPLRPTARPLLLYLSTSRLAGWHPRGDVCRYWRCTRKQHFREGGGAAWRDVRAGADAAIGEMLLFVHILFSDVLS